MSWRKNLYAVVISEFFVLIGYGFFNPLLPLYIKEIGQFLDKEAAVMTGIANGGAGFAMFISSPLWGMAADRWGKKPMLLRAQFGGVVLACLMAITTQAPLVVIWRICSGIFTGSVSAASALIASQTPKEKLSFALGLLILAMFSGTTIGPFLGGLLADQMGFQAAFFTAGGLLLLGGLIILFFIKEKQEKRDNVNRAALSDMWHLATSRKMLPLLIVTVVIFAGPQLISPIIPLAIQEINPQTAATAAGLSLALMGLFSIVSSVIAGRIANKIPLKTILIFSSLATGLLYIPPIWAANLIQFIIFIGLTGLFIGGLQTSSNTLISVVAPRERQGLAYGLSASAVAVGVGLGSILGGSAAAALGLRSVFAIGAGIFILVGIMAYKQIVE